MVSPSPDSVKVRRFPRPWRIVGSHAAYWIEDADGKGFGYCYFLDEVKGSDQLQRLTRAEALVIVRNIAKLGD